MFSFRLCIDERVGSILRRFSETWSADLTTVAVGESVFADCLGASAMAASNHVLFAPGSLDLESREGLSLLGHELMHLLQQRRISSENRTRVLLDPKLENEANAEADRAAALVWAQTRNDRPWHGRLEMAQHCYLSPSDFRGIIQCKIKVGDEVYKIGIAPLSSWGLTDEQKTFYNFLLGVADRTFPFANRARMLAFIKSDMMLRIFKNTDSFQGPRMLPYFAEINSVVPGALQRRDSLWCVPLDVNTDKGSQTVNVYCSVKRHLITTFMRSQFTQVDHKLVNIAVRDGDVFATKLAAYAAHQARKIKDNCMLYGYDPKAADAGFADAEIKFETDTIFMPSTGWALPNPIHAFPASGSLTRALSQDEHKALVTFLLWFFRTEEHLSEGESFNKISRLEGAHATLAEKEVETNTRRAKAALQLLKNDYKLDFPVGADKVDETAKGLEITFQANKKLKHYRQLLAEAGQCLHQVLAATGEIPAITKPMVVSKNKAAGIKAESKVGGPDVRFKTHKVEVKAQIGFLSPELVAWAIEGHTAVSANNILTAISTSTKVKNHVKAQIAIAKDELGNQLKDVRLALVKVGQLAQIAYAHDLIKLT